MIGTDVQDRLDRAVLGMGMLALACAATTVLRGDLDFRIRGWGLVVTLVLGLLAVLVGALGRLRRRERGPQLARTASPRPAFRLALLPGLGFLAAAVLQIVQLGGEAGNVENGVLGGNAATFVVWLGLGIGLTVLGLARGQHRPTTGSS